MIPKLYIEAEVARALHRDRGWLVRWLREHPVDKHGTPFYYQLGKGKRFTGDDVVRLIDHILTIEEAERGPPGDGFVYFVDGGDAIKIGFTRSMKARLEKMHTDVPGGPVLLHFEPGTFKTEKVLHRHFADLRLRGEWFRKSPELLAHISGRRDITGGQQQ